MLPCLVFKIILYMCKITQLHLPSSAFCLVGSVKPSKCANYTRDPLALNCLKTTSWYRMRTAKPSITNAFQQTAKREIKYLLIKAHSRCKDSEWKVMKIKAYVMSYWGIKTSCFRWESNSLRYSSPIWLKSQTAGQWVHTIRSCVNKLYFFYGRERRIFQYVRADSPG